MQGISSFCDLPLFQRCQQRKPCSIKQVNSNIRAIEHHAPKLPDVCKMVTFDMFVIIFFTGFLFRLDSPSRPVSLYNILRLSSAAIDLVPSRLFYSSSDFTQQETSASAASSPANTPIMLDAINVSSSPMQVKNSIHGNAAKHSGKIPMNIFYCGLSE